MTYKVGICDDETLQLKVEALYLNEIAKNNHIDIKYKSFENAGDLISFLHKYTLDVLLLDIDLKNDISGIEIAEKLMIQYPDMVIIFVTGHREFAYEAFDIEAIGYIIKPIEIKKFERILLKAFQFIDGKRNTSESMALIITNENIKKKINQDDIIYIQRRAAKSYIVTKDKEYHVYETITSLYERLKGDFIRINQSEIVSLKRINEIRDNYVYLKPDKSFHIGRTYRNDVIEAYFGKKNNIRS